MKALKIKKKRESTQTEVNENTFRIEIKAVTPLDDVFEVYYTDESPEENFSGKKKIRKKTNAGSDFQTIEFKLPKEKFPFKFRLDLGENKQQEEIRIDQILLSYNNKQIIIAKDSIQFYFIANQFLKSDKMGSYKLITINDKRDPFIIAKALLIKKIELEL